MDLEALNDVIDRAFVGISRDEECTLHQAQLSDHSMSRDISDSEWNAAKERDQELDWRLIPMDFLDECDAALSHASPQSWHFYIPAYMRRALQLLNDDTGWLPGGVIHHLTYPRYRSSLAAYVLERFHTLNSAQIQAVTSFLEYVRNAPVKGPWDTTDIAADSALRGYWHLDEQIRPQEPKIILL